MGVVAGSAAASAVVRHQLLLSFTRQPDDFAELYFPSPSTLPTSYIPGRPLTLKFGVTNDSVAARTYDYVVTAGSGDGHTTVEDTGTLRLGADRAAVTPLRVTLAPGTTSLSVRLTRQPVVIRLLLNQRVARGR
jgi:hypothetical protein